LEATTEIKPRKLVLETTAPFQGLPELVAYDEGLFEKEGLLIEWADREQGVEKKVETHVTSPKEVDPFASHGKLFEQGKADMYNACEWGNYCRVQATGAGSRQVGRRAIVTYSALVVAPDSPVYTPQQLANRTIGVPFYFGTHYIALHMLEGFLRREEIKLCRAPNGSRYRLAALMKGELDATTLTEPHITLAEKKGCRIICSAFFHGTEVASERVDAETYAAFNRAVREAVRRINANKRAYLHYFIDDHGQDRSGDRRAEGGRPAREPAGGLRSRADPARRDAAHLRLAQELGHARADGVPARSRQHGRAALRPPGGGVTHRRTQAGRKRCSPNKIARPSALRRTTRSSTCR
jgi:NitT/TauT family transport system substrate-binding protein